MIPFIRTLFLILQFSSLILSPGKRKTSKWPLILKEFITLLLTHPELLWKFLEKYHWSIEIIKAKIKWIANIKKR